MRARKAGAANTVSGPGIRKLAEEGSETALLSQAGHYDEPLPTAARQP
jgi:hypothetical protein